MQSTRHAALAMLGLAVTTTLSGWGQEQASLIALSPLAQLRFTKEYFPGTRDARGQFMGGTQAMWLAGFKGRLYAGIGYGQDQAGDDPQPGAQILCKDAADAPWRVDHAYGPGFMRIEALLPVRFSADYTGKRLEEPVELLVVSPSDTRRGKYEVAIWTLRAVDEGWQYSRIAAGYLGARALYFAGYDGPYVDNRTARIYRATLSLARDGEARAPRASGRWPGSQPASASVSSRLD